MQDEEEELFEVVQVNHEGNDAHEEFPVREEDRISLPPTRRKRHPGRKRRRRRSGKSSVSLDEERHDVDNERNEIYDEPNDDDNGSDDDDHDKGNRRKPARRVNKIDTAVSQSRRQLQTSLSSKIDDRDKLSNIIDTERQRIVEFNEQQLHRNMEEWEMEDVSKEEARRRRKEMKNEMRSKLASLTSNERLRRIVLNENKASVTSAAERSIHQRSVYVENTLNGHFQSRHQISNGKDLNDDLSESESGAPEQNDDVEHKILLESCKFRAVVQETNHLILSAHSFLRGLLAGASLFQVLVTFIPDGTIAHLFEVNSSFSVTSQGFFSFLSMAVVVLSWYLLLNDAFPPISVLAIENHGLKSGTSLEETGIRHRHLMTMVVCLTEVICYSVAFICSIGTSPSNDFFWIMRRSDGGNWYTKFVSGNDSVEGYSMYLSRLILWIIFTCMRAVACNIPWIISSILLTQSTTTRQDQIIHAEAKESQKRFKVAMSILENEKEENETLRNVFDTVTKSRTQEPRKLHPEKDNHI